MSKDAEQENLHAAYLCGYHDALKEVESEQGVVVWVAKGKDIRGPRLTQVFAVEPTKSNAQSGNISFESDEVLLAGGAYVMSCFGLPVPVPGHCIRVTLHSVVEEVE